MSRLGNIVILNLFFCGLVTVSCNKPLEGTPLIDPSQEEIPQGYVRLYLEKSPLQDQQTKVIMQGLQVNFEQGDLIDVNGRNCSIQISGTEAYVDVPAASEYKAFYPAQILKGGDCYIQPVQYYSEGSFGKYAQPMYARGSEGTLEFEHHFGVLKLRIAGEGEICSISVKDNSEGSLWGVFTRNGDELAASDMKGSQICLDCIDENTLKGVNLSPSGTDFYICLPAGEYSDGFTISISGTDGHACTIDSSTPRVITKGTVLQTPVINYGYESDQIFSYNFDSFVWGGNPVEDRMGFSIDTKNSPSGFEISTSKTESSKDSGTAQICTSTAIGPENFDFVESYWASRNIASFARMMRVREYQGCLGMGIGSDYRALFRTPRFSNLPAGKVCMAEVSFDMAFEEGVSEPIQFIPEAGGSGMVLEYWVDGVKVDIPKDDASRWSRADNTPGLTVGLFEDENLLIRPEDFSGTLWHRVKIVLGAVSNTTWLNFQALNSSSNSNGFYLDNLEVRALDYPQSSLTLKPSIIISAYNAKMMSSLAAQGRALGFEEVDLSISSEYLFNSMNGDRETWQSTFAAQKQALDEAGIKVGAIHLPYQQLSSLEDNIFEFAASYDVRERAVALMSEIMEYLSVFEPKYYVAHPVRNKNLDYNQFRNYLKLSCQSLVAKAQELGSVFCIENLASSDVNSICGAPEHYNWFCEQVPGLKLCFDSSHAIVGGNCSAEDFARTLGGNIACVHLHDGDTTADIHLFPKYSGIYTDHSATIDWKALITTLVEDCGYSGSMMYEVSTYAVDAIVSLNSVAHNYYGTLCPEYQI
ncbi:MAG: sugar phosphate isomerase/epimerase family protein [Candidatus Cryptobacteroides sp.]